MSYTYQQCKEKDDKTHDAFESTMSEWLAAEAIGESEVVAEVLF